MAHSVLLLFEKDNYYTYKLHRALEWIPGFQLKSLSKQWVVLGQWVLASRGTNIVLRSSCWLNCTWCWNLVWLVLRHSSIYPRIWELSFSTIIWANTLPCTAPPSPSFNTDMTARLSCCTTKMTSVIHLQPRQGEGIYVWVHEAMELVGDKDLQTM